MAPLGVGVAESGGAEARRADLGQPGRLRFLSALWITFWIGCVWFLGWRVRKDSFA